MNIDEVRRALAAAQGDPEKLTLATLDIFLTDRDPQLRVALEAAAVPHWFDAAILAALLDLPANAAQATLVSLRALPMVETFEARGGWNVHEATRLALRGRLAREHDEHFRLLSSRAAGCFNGDDPPQQIEHIYHRLCAAPDEAAEELRRLWEQWHRGGRPEPLQALGVALEELLHADALPPAPRARALVCLGWIRAPRATLQERERMACEAGRLLDELGDEPGRADAHDQLGDVLQVQGNLANALREYQAYKAITERLTARDPDNSDWLRDLSVSHNKVGSVLRAQGRLSDALREYLAGKVIMEHLVAREPDNGGWQRELSVSHNRVGSVLKAQGNLPDALREYQAGKAIMERLAARDPNNADWQRGLSILHNDLGSVLQAQGNLAEALNEYQSAKPVRERLAARDRANTDWQRSLSALYNNVGTVLSLQGKAADALREYQDANAILERLAGNDPDNTEWQRDLSVSHHNIGRELQTQGKFADALVTLEAGLAIAERLAALDPSNAQWQEDLSATRRALAELHEQMRGGAPGNPAGGS